MSNVLLSGVIGEIGVCEAFHRLQSYFHCEFIHNFPLRGVRSMQQIDAILLTPFGFYSVEIKNWDCTLYIDPSAKYWLAEYPNRQILVPSPVRQNQEHVRYLRRSTYRPFNSLIIFPDEAILRPQTSSTINISGLGDFFRFKPTIYTDKDIDDTYKLLLKLKKSNEAEMVASFLLKGGNRT